MSCCCNQTTDDIPVIDLDNAKPRLYESEPGRYLEFPLREYRYDAFRKEAEWTFQLNLYEILPQSNDFPDGDLRQWSETVKVIQKGVSNALTLGDEYNFNEEEIIYENGKVPIVRISSIQVRVEDLVEQSQTDFSEVILKTLLIASYVGENENKFETEFEFPDEYFLPFISQPIFYSVLPDHECKLVRRCRWGGKICWNEYVCQRRICTQKPCQAYGNSYFVDCWGCCGGRC